MAKKRKAARKTRKPAVRKTTTRTAKLKGRKVTKPKARRAKKQGVIAGALGAIGEAVRLRTRMGGHNRFEDQ